jgi:hypothetical protein
MAKRSGAVHVAKIVRRYNDREYVSHLLRRTYRDNGKVRHETLGNISALPADTIELIRASLRGERLMPAGEAFRIQRSLPHGHVAAVWAQARALGLPELLGPPCAQRDLAAALIVARVCRPGSKLASTRWWTDTTLAADLGVAEATTDDVYAAMDWLADRQQAIETQLAARHLTAGGLVLVDLSCSYVEGRHNELAALGYSRDGKRGKAQINYALVTDCDGQPVAVRVLTGDTADPAAFTAVVEQVREQFGLHQVVFVGDRGMITSARIDALKQLEGAGWISALRAPAIAKLAEQGAIQLSLFDQTDLAEITHPDYPDERLVACRNPALAAERARKRADLLDATDTELAKIKSAVDAGRLKDPVKIGIRTGRVANKFKMAKHFEITIAEGVFSYQRHQDAIDAEAALDGVYVIRAANTTANQLTAAETVEAYKRLRLVEADFRSLKTVDLELRPIYHRREQRVRAHVLICMLANYLCWHLRQAWAPLCFTDEHPLDRRHDPVGKAERSPAAQHKASTRRTSHDGPAHSFHTLLDHLCTLTRNTCQIAEQTATIDVLAELTPLQRQTFELLDTTVPLKLT